MNNHEKDQRFDDGASVRPDFRDTGQRIQKFLRYGEETGCSGTGSADVGLYSLNR